MSNYYVIFRGEIAEGFEVDEVKENIASILEEDEEAMEDLFSGRTLVIKRDPSLTQCQKLRDVFLAIGAVCYIRDSEGQTESEIAENGNGASTGAVEEDSLSQENSAGSAQNISAKLISSKDQLKEKLESYRYKISEFWSEVSGSVKSDAEVGGVKLLAKNKYFLSTLGASILLALVLVFSLIGERKAMPISEQNFSTIIEHIEFIEKAFTIDELRSMTKDPRDFLDYLLADPIKKMGYEFDASIEDIADTFLQGDFTNGELQKVKTYLEITAHERDKLMEHGFITEGLRIKLEAVSKEMEK